MNVANGVCSCQDGFVNISNVCKICTQPCSTCQTTQCFCLTCTDVNMQVNLGVCQCNSGYVEISLICMACILPCQACQINQTTCLQCTDVNMVLNSSPQCQCKDGYFISNFTCLTCSQPCQNCINNSTYCIKCDQTLKRYLFNNTCLCMDGFYENNGICSQCVFPCSSCLTQIQCTSCSLANMSPIAGICTCNTGYLYLQGQCTNCLLPCATCITDSLNCIDCIDSNMSLNSTPKCQCRDGFYLSSPSKCSICQFPCATCNQTSTYCITCSGDNRILKFNSCPCDLGYYEINSICDKCQDPCLECITKQDYCVRCVDNLSILQNGNCQCPQNYFMNVNFTCTICKLPCLSCFQDESNCATCIDSLMKIDSTNQCICQTGYLQINNFCVQCISNCDLCTDTSTCQICTLGYILNNLDKTCIQCNKLCQTCEISIDICTSCINNLIIQSNGYCICQDYYYLQNFECYPCSRNCATCTTETICTKCLDINQIELKDGYCQCKEGYFEEQEFCQICDILCQTCDFSSKLCLSCYSDQFRILNDSQCVCDDGYFDDEGICMECTTINGIQYQECNYRNCGDAQWTYGERCDDGNQISRDGCSNCTIDKGYSCLNVILQTSYCFQCGDNCLSCNNQNYCTQCLAGYYLEQNYCSICDYICLTCDSKTNCLTCRFQSIQGKCILCEQKQGYFIDQISNQCISICGDGIQSDIEECDDGNQQNNDGCNILCKLEYGFSLENGVLINELPLTPQLNEYYQNENHFKNQRIFYLTYDQLLISNDKLSDYLEYQITNYSQYKDFTYQTIDQSINYPNQTMNFKIQVNITLYQSLKNEYFCIKFNNLQDFQSQLNILQKQQIICQLISQYQLVDDMTIKNTQSAQTFSYCILIILGALVLVALLFGGIDVFYNLLDILQLISYLQYINTQLPYNLEQFLNIFAFAQFSYLDQYLSPKYLIADYIDNQKIIQPPQKISQDGFSSSILLNIYPIVQVWTVFLFSYILTYKICQLLIKIKINVEFSNIGWLKIQLMSFQIFVKNLLLKICWKFKDQFFWSIFLRTFYSTAYDLCFMIFLNLYVLDVSDDYLFNQISQLTAIVLLGFYLIVIYQSLKIMDCQNSMLKFKKNKFGSIYEGLKLDRVSKLFNVFLLIKKLLLMMVLVLLYNYPLLQEFYMLLLSLFTVVYLQFFEPLVQEVEYRKQYYSEVYMLLIQILISILVLDDYLEYFSYEQRSIIGWGCIFFISAMLITQMILDIIQQLKIFIKIISKIFKFILQIIQKEKQIHPKTSSTDQILIY